MAFAAVVFATSLLRGTVTDATNLPLPGATISVKGSDRFAVTGDRGEFEIDVAPGTRLVVALPGFTTREVVAPANAPLNVVLQVATVATAVTVRATTGPPPVDSRVAMTALDVVR